MKRLTIGDEEPIDCRPADLILPGYGKAAAEIGHLARSEEDVLSYALLPQVARDFLRRGGRRKRRGLRPCGGGETLAEDAIALEDSAPIGPLSEADVPGTRGGQRMAMTQGVYITILGMAILLICGLRRRDV